MSVYVDEPMFPYRGQMYCHMAADGDLEELHQMADRIGLSRRWFQDHPQHPHYDLSPSKRALAVRYGAIETTTLELARNCYWNKPGTYFTVTIQNTLGEEK